MYALYYFHHLVKRCHCISFTSHIARYIRWAEIYTSIYWLRQLLIGVNFALPVNSSYPWNNLPTVIFTASADFTWLKIILRLSCQGTVQGWVHQVSCIYVSAMITHMHLADIGPSLLPLASKLLSIASLIPGEVASL